MIARMMRAGALALLVLLAWGVTAASAQTTVGCQGRGPYTMPAGVNLLCSKAWYWTAPCNNADFVYNSRFNGGTTWKLVPWEAQPIVIVGVELALTGSPSPAGDSADVWWLMIGNNTVPDAMGFLARGGERHLKTWFPAGTGMPFPSSATATADDYLDIHGGCTSGQVQTEAHGFLTIYYTVHP